MIDSGNKNSNLNKIKTYLENNKIFFETIAALLISIMAIIVSISQCSISKSQTELLKVQTDISKNMYLSSLEPDIRIRFHENKSADSYDVIIKNLGMQLVYELRIKTSFRIFNLGSSDPIMSIKDSDYKLILDTLSVRDSVVYGIQKKDFINPSIYNLQIDKKTGFPIVTSEITYRRFPDNKEFKSTKHLLILYNPEAGILGSVDLDKDIISREIFDKRNLIEN